MKLWLTKLSLMHPPVKNARICQFHFEDKYLLMDPKFVIAPHLYNKPKHFLADDAIPTIFAHKDRGIAERTASVKRKRRQMHREVIVLNTIICYSTSTLREYNKM